MTTEKLIKGLRYNAKLANLLISCGVGNENTEKLAALLTESANKLEKAYTALKEQGYCNTCKYKNICSGEGDADTGCNSSDKWEWAGDEE